MYNLKLMSNKIEENQQIERKSSVASETIRKSDELKFACMKNMTKLRQRWKVEPSTVASEPGVESTSRVS